jgi:hypothetical protein
MGAAAATTVTPHGFVSTVSIAHKKRALRHNFAKKIPPL